MWNTWTYGFERLKEGGSSQTSAEKLVCPYLHDEGKPLNRKTFASFASKHHFSWFWKAFSIYISEQKKSNLKLFLQFRQNEMLSLLLCIMIKVLLKWYLHCGGMPLSFGIENPFIMEIDRVSASCKQMYTKTANSYASTYIKLFCQQLQDLQIRRRTEKFQLGFSKSSSFSNFINFQKFPTKQTLN